MNEAITAEVIFDAQMSVACTLYRILGESKGPLPTMPGDRTLLASLFDTSPSRALYDQTRRDLTAQLISRLEGLVPPDVIRAAAACENS